VRPEDSLLFYFAGNCYHAPNPSCILNNIIAINDMIFKSVELNSDIFYFASFYLLTPWSRVLLEKLTGSQLVQKFPAFFGTRRFITAFTSARL
jgi:hypothetical protein